MVLEFATGLFIIAFVLWQIAAPLLQGRPPFPLFRGTPRKDYMPPKPPPARGPKGGMR
jgi:hypothetical protein